MGHIGAKSVQNLPGLDLSQFAISSLERAAQQKVQKPAWKRLLVAARICAENQNTDGANVLYRDALLSVREPQEREEIMAFINDELWTIQREVLQSYFIDGCR